MSEDILDDSDKLKIERQKNQELKRIEDFLRGEVKVLRRENQNILDSNSYKIGSRITNNFFYKLFKKIYNTTLHRKQAVASKEEGELRVEIIKNHRSDKTYKNIVAKGSFDFLFVQLTNNAEIGGVHQLNSIFEKIKETEFSAKSVYLNKDLSRPEIGFDSEIDFERSQFKNVVFSGLEAYKFIKNTPSLGKAKKINFLQGPDYLFPGNEIRLSDFSASLIESDLVISQSPYLDKIAHFFGAKSRKTITLGPKENIFFDRGINKEKIVLIPTRVEPDKGLRFILPALSRIKSQGWQALGFGDVVRPELTIHFDEHLGRISREEVASLLQNAALVLDLSTYEGLGLTALEAGMCGTRTIVSSKSGLASLDEFNSEIIHLNNPLDLGDIVASVVQYDITSNEPLRTKLTQSARAYSWENNIAKIIEGLTSL